MGIKIHATRSKIRLKKMIIVSPETHSSLFLIKAKIQKHKVMNITFDEVITMLLSHYHQVYRLDEKE